MTTTVKAPSKKVAKNAPRTRSTMPDGPGTVAAVRGSAPIGGLRIGGEPRVHLLPPQVVARKKAKVLRRRLGLGIIGVLVVVGVAGGLAELASVSAASALISAQSETTAILQQQAKYGDVLKVKADAASILSSQKLSTAQEISWKPFVASFQKTLPAGASITSITAGVDVPFGVPPTGSTPLAGPGVATVTATVAMTQAEISGWLDTLPGIKGFVDATPNSVTLSPDGSYAVAITMHLDKDALANRFTKDAGQTK
jgi:hypothetical protein